jgi:Flp pilus assembly protein TadG
MRMTLASRLGLFVKRLNALIRGKDGLVSVEFVLWMPVFFLILAFTADACVLYLMQADMWNVARDTARRMATGQLTTTAAAQTYASGQLLYPTKPYTYTITQGTDDVVGISIPISSASIFGVLAVYGSFSSATLNAQVTMRAEQ